MSNRVQLDIERLNSFYITPQALFRALHYAFSQLHEGTPLNCLNALTPTTQFLAILKEADKKPEFKAAVAPDEVHTPADILATRAIALMRLLADFFIDRSVELNENRLKAELDKLWPRREFITAAAFTPLKNYTNCSGAPCFDPWEFIKNVNLIKNSMGKHLGHFPWGSHARHV